MYLQNKGFRLRFQTKADNTGRFASTGCLDMDYLVYDRLGHNEDNIRN